MRNILSFLFFISSSVIALASHDYIPLLAPQNSWVTSTYKGIEEFSLGEKTIIDGKEYYCVICKDMSMPELAIQGIDSTSCFLREEGKKVYYKDKTYMDHPEWLIFDFGLTTDEMVELKPLQARTEICFIRVDSTDTIVLNGLERAVLYVSYGIVDDNYYVTDDDIWIEGIGSTKLPFLPLDNLRFGAVGYSDFRYYYDYASKYIYPEDREFYDFSGIIGTMAEMQLSLRRCGDVVMASFPMAEVGECLTVYDAAGRAVVSQPVRQGATTAILPMAEQPAGVYIVKLQSGEAVKLAW